MPKSLISIKDFTKDEILHVLEVAKEFEANREQNFLQGKVIACLFFEPSTRTRLSFESAVNRLGAKVIGFADNKNTSQSKGETLEDTIKIVSNYVDMIVMRHPMEGAAAIAASVSPVPVVNAGDGANQHPTQTLLDMYTIQQTQGKLDQHGWRPALRKDSALPVTGYVRFQDKVHLHCSRGAQDAEQISPPAR